MTKGDYELALSELRSEAEGRYFISERYPLVSGSLQQYCSYNFETCAKQLYPTVQWGNTSAENMQRVIHYYMSYNDTSFNATRKHAVKKSSGTA